MNISAILSSISNDGSEIVREYTTVAKKEFEFKLDSSGLTKEDKSLFSRRFEEQLAIAGSGYEDAANGLNSLTATVDAVFSDKE